MTYVSLYRKYRPQTFAEVIGQDHVTVTLANAITEDRLHHAYLFTGPRGTGKTSTARILAKSLNCEHGPTPSPCNACAQCEGITAGASVDVIEIDAASHGGVDDVRDLRERVAFAPAAARKKVYIVDECHMLSTAGWNAFLKTVEEPPDHVVFVFATTEPHKVLPTILSRTQRFDFKRVAADVLASHLDRLATLEGLTFEPGVVDLLVRAGDGSVRDTLSVLDQVVAFTGVDVTAHGVADVLGTVPDELLGDAAGSIAAGDVGALCRLVQRLADAGIDPRQFARDLVGHLRELFLLQVAPGVDLVEGTPERLGRLRAEAGRLGRADLLRAIELLGEAQAQMRRGNTRLPLEVALAKAAMPDACGDAGALAARIDRLERRTGVVGAEPAAVTVDVGAGAPDDTASPGTVASGAAAVGTGAAPASEVAPGVASGAAAVAAGAAPGVGLGSARAAGEAAPEVAAEAAPEVGLGSAPEVGLGSAPEVGLGAAAASAADARGAADEAPPSVPGAAAAPPADARGAAGEAGGAPAASPASPAEMMSAAPVDIGFIETNWTAVLEATKSRTRRLHAFVAEGHPAALEDAVLTLRFRPGYAFHAENCSNEAAQQVLGGVFEQVLGVRLRVRCVVADGDDGPLATTADDDEESAVLETEAAEAAGDLPDGEALHALAVETLQRDLGATIVQEGRRS